MNKMVVYNVKQQQNQECQQIEWKWSWQAGQKPYESAYGNSGHKYGYKKGKAFFAGKA